MNKKAIFSGIAFLVFGLLMVSNIAPASAQTNNPTVSSISPTSASTGSSDTSLTVRGTNFASGSVVLFDNSQLDTTYVSSTELRTTIPGSMLANAGSKNITVRNSGGETSNQQVFTVTTASLPDTGLDPANAIGLNTTTLIVTLIIAMILFIAVARVKQDYHN